MIDLRGFQRGLLLIVTLFVLSACAAASANTGSTPQQAAGAQPGVALPLVIKAQPTAIPTATNLPTATATATATPPPVWRFVVLGDTRTSGFDPPQVTKDIVAKASSANPEITLAVGDLILSKSTPTDVDTQWQNWRAAVQPLGKGASIPDWLLVTPGNHDVESAAWAIDRMAAAFPELPTNGPSGLERLAYRKDYGNVRFISIVSERYKDAHRIDDQLDWLETQLQNNPQKYTIVFSHDPAYPFGAHINSSLDAYPAARDKLWSLLKQYKVTAYIAGHEHLYYRSVHDGVAQLIIGTSGSSLYPIDISFYHYAVAEVSAEHISFVIYDSSGTERDRFVLP